MNPNGNPLVQEVGLDLDTCLKTGRAVWTFGHAPYRIYPINTRSRRGKEKPKCILQLVRRLSLLHREYAPIKKIRPPAGWPDAHALPGCCLCVCLFGRWMLPATVCSIYPKAVWKRFQTAFSSYIRFKKAVLKAGCYVSQLLKSFCVLRNL